MGNFKKISLVSISIAILAIAIVSIYLSNRPPQQDFNSELFPGIIYSRQARFIPRPIMVHLIDIDLNTANINLFVTPGDPESEQELPARTTSEFVVQTLNSPIHKRIPMWERAVGNHLGIFVLNEDGDTAQAPDFDN